MGNTGRRADTTEGASIDRRALKALWISWLLCATSAQCASANATQGWPAWDAFVDRFVQPDGRVVDLTFGGKSTSEGQSYALFFALVADQHSRFDTILQWTSNNLAEGKLGKRLPAWLWGKRDDGSWGVKDENSASDADLWMAYTLLEAARVWQEPRYAVTARQLLAQIRRQDIVSAGSAGRVLLPGPIGFSLDRGRFRINPSYLPGFMFRYLAVNDAAGPWQSVWDGYMHLAPKVFAGGVAPNLFVVDRAGHVMPDTEAEPSGSYDAIRVYMWAGMSGASARPLLEMLSVYAELIRRLGTPPEKVDPRTAMPIPSDYSPIGFSGAVLPYLSALGDQQAVEKQHERVRAAALRAQNGEVTHYYDQVLILFGEGWLDGRFRFDEQGRVVLNWQHARE